MFNIAFENDWFKKMNPGVSVILLCHNQASFVAEALRSVWHQTYAFIQLIVVDDASTDGSTEVIKNLLKDKPQVPFIGLSENRGNCAAFNEGLKLAAGKYIIDLAADDILMPERVGEQVAFFESLGEEYGVIYSNARYIEEKGAVISDHFTSGAVPPQGEIYKEVVSTYFIPPPTMMMRKKVLDELGGYDSGLAYEDFDFWVRSARKYKYAYQPSVLTSIRKVDGSLSTRAYRKHDRQLYSTYLVCQKIRKMNITRSEDEALSRRLKYEIRHAVFTANFNEADLFIGMLREKEKLPLYYKILSLISQTRINLRWLRIIYLFSTAKFFAPKAHLQ